MFYNKNLQMKYKYSFFLKQYKTSMHATLKWYVKTKKAIYVALTKGMCRTDYKT